MNSELSTDKEKHNRRRKRNLVAKSLKEFKPQVLPDIKTKYKRTKIHLKDINYDSEDY